MKITKLLPEELQVGMEVFIYGHHIIEFEKPCIVSRLYSPTDRTRASVKIDSIVAAMELQTS